jgi:putative transposase
MQVQRIITVLLPDDEDLRRTVSAFNRIQSSASASAHNDGRPLSALALHRIAYGDLSGSVNSQMTCTAIRLVAGAYAAQKSNIKRKKDQEAKRKAKFLARGWNYKPRKIKPLSVCTFDKPHALFLIGKRGRDADFRADGTLSIWTVAGRKRIVYNMPEVFRERFENAVEYDSLTVIERNGRLYGQLALTLEAPDPQGVVPVGIDLNETNALVAMGAGDEPLFITGRTIKIKNRRTADVVSRLQKKLATHKAKGADTHSVRRNLKRLSRRRQRRTKDFACCTAKRLIEWAPANAVLVFEDLKMPEPQRGHVRANMRARLSHWQHGAIRQAVRNKAEMCGISVTLVDPACTSKNCSACGLRGIRKRHLFRCPQCGHTDHADVNAAKNIRQRFVLLRQDGAQSIAPEALR